MKNKYILFVIYYKFFPIYTITGTQPKYVNKLLRSRQKIRVGTDIFICYTMNSLLLLVVKDTSDIWRGRNINNNMQNVSELICNKQCIYTWLELSIVYYK